MNIDRHTVLFAPTVNPLRSLVPVQRFDRLALIFAGCWLPVAAFLWLTDRSIGPYWVIVPLSLIVFLSVLRIGLPIEATVTGPLAAEVAKRFETRLRELGPLSGPWVPQEDGRLWRARGLKLSYLWDPDITVNRHPNRLVVTGPAWVVRMLILAAVRETEPTGSSSG